MDLSGADGQQSLEERLKGLILSNSGDKRADHASNNLLNPLLPGSVPSNPQLFNGPDGTHASLASGHRAIDDSPKPLRRRPNQAQRRQMAAEIIVPIDIRPQQTRDFRFAPNRNASHQNDTTMELGNRTNQRPHSVSFRPNQQFRDQHHGRSGMENGPMANALKFQGPYGPRGSQPHVQSQAPDARRRLYEPGRSSQVRNEDLQAQAAMLEQLSATVMANAEIDFDDLREKENVRMGLEQVCREVITKYEAEQHGHMIPPWSVELKCFGSLASGFATKVSDMDLALVSPLSPQQPDEPGSPIPRLVEKAFLSLGIGARLLTRTRVPILKVCEHPPEQLRTDLVEERLKWELGLVEEEDGHNDEQQDDHAASPTEQTRNSDQTKDGQVRQDSKVANSSSTTYEQKLASLKQTGNKSLNAYCSMAKAVLRKLGGRDMTVANIGGFTDEDFKILKDVILAFVNGLADDALKKRLFSVKSLSPDELAKPRTRRSLASVFTQVEGEKLAMLWDSRVLPEKDAAHGTHAQQAMANWSHVQNKATFGSDPLAYAKEIHSYFERLTNIPSLRLTVLQQDQHESAVGYHTRAIRLMIQLGSADHPGSKILPVVVRQYTAGIYNHDIRKDVEEFVEFSQPHSLRAVARKHKALQLAYDFEKALAKSYYTGSDEQVVRAYINVLRSPMIASSKIPAEHFDFVVPKTSVIAQDILPAILSLPNPATLAPNQPRDRYRDRLEFPKTGAGVQCDINFSAHLALHNTALLRCYSFTDPRVTPLVLFVKHWAKVRNINNPYRGTLSSYGYVLMMLHYLVNVADPFVCPNLQLVAPPPDPNLSSAELEKLVICKGRIVHFWRDEEKIKDLAQQHALNHNPESIGQLLRGFFEYYAFSGNSSARNGARGFDWGRDVISLRTHSGILSKHEKGWILAKTTIEKKEMMAPPSVDSAASGAVEGTGSAQGQTKQEVKEVRHRYLFAIEDPFEIDHNVARTVTHDGIVAIRNEFRRAWAIIKSVGTQGKQEDLFKDPIVEEERRNREMFSVLLEEIHGKHELSSLSSASHDGLMPRA